MPQLKTSTHQIQIPDSFEKTYVILDGLLKAETAKAGHSIQCPECSVAPTNYPNRKSFDEWVRFKLETYCEAPNELANETLEVLNTETEWREYSDLWTWNDKESTVHYFLGGVPTELGPWFVFQAFCEAEVVETYRPLFQAVWQSLVWSGDMPVDLDGPATGLLTNSASDQKGAEANLPIFAPPESGPGIALFDDSEIRLSVEDCSVSISSTLHELCMEIRFHPQDLRASHQELVSEYAASDSFGFRFTFSGVHQDGVPSGEFVLKDGKAEGRRVGFWLDGWNHSLEFTGTFTFQDSWFGMRGFLTKPYDDRRKVKVETYLKIDSAALDWSDYRFLSLQETHGASPESIRFLQIPKPEPLPDSFFRLPNLKELTIGPLYSYGSQKIEEIPLDLDHRLGELSQLEVLTIHNCSVGQIPAAIGRLKKLTRCRIVNADLQMTPPELWKLPQLSLLCLSHNKLHKLPARIDLPNLEHLELENNSLSTLPRSLLNSSNLLSLSLSNNPWQSLEQRFLEVKGLRLDQADRLRLFDYTYPGADKEGLVEWDDETFKLSSDRELYQRFEARVTNAGHSEYQDALKVIAKRTVHFTLSELDDYSQVGMMRFGGMPDLPQSLPYPTWEYEDRSYGYEFVSQLNCEELAPYQNYLPRAGLLYFFISDQESFKPRVLYFDGPKSELVSGSQFDPQLYPLLDEYGERIEAHTATITSGWSLPSDYSSHCNHHDFPKAARVFLENDQLLYNISQDINFSASQQHHEINPYVFTQHESPELQAALSKRGNPEDWMVLLKLASVGGFQWWDAGEIFFVIHKSDLKKSDFSNVYCGLETS